jgi:hypothetical protein
VPAAVFVPAIVDADDVAGLERRRSREATVELDQLRADGDFMAAFDYLSVSV